MIPAGARTVKIEPVKGEITRYVLVNATRMCKLTNHLQNGPWLGKHQAQHCHAKQN
jgi:hypothetical protein